ncbi:glucose-6-phosphate 1-dehydrogenase [Paraburkholderia hospita]|uniref:Glucose-6-phosphate 1-dehydrogenase n=1 Tax=Paraburkholderia hospita TaxID=169430 RepID=A0ABN0FAF4_9BURK|nr:glucose-6-phosphate dehydrogenase [Paraburkholderia hospita]EIM95580.1 glucose-6-phosphate 1-dehydrogenase [Paraburkholderia hospita]OUL84572.1 glucose-6-phosphate dehydrogenase [Paraburkholderia hospita]
MKPESFAFVLFGATGDLAKRKILPALFEAHRAGLLPADGKIVGVARGELNEAGYRDWISTHVREHLAAGDIDDPAWTDFLSRISYLPLDLSAGADFMALKAVLDGVAGVRVLYLATGPSLFVPTCQALAAVGLNRDARVVLEKPLGHDLHSSNAINDAVGELFDEDQIYRIDHYLGKESVQNLLALRFGNVLFEPLWRREWVSNIQITIAEELGAEERGEFYDSTGALRDMVQNHLLQLLAIVAMEPPHSMDSDSVRDEKLRVLRALKPITSQFGSTMAVRGQYREGVIRGERVPAYVEEKGVCTDSTTETFVALKVEIENWRWAGVPFFLRTGKRLAGRMAEIVVNFRLVPHAAIGTTGSDLPLPNRLVIRLQPNESIRLYAQAKKPGEGMNLASVYLDLAFDQFFRQTQMEAYQRLLLDVIHGRLSLFVRRDEQETAWKWVDPLLRAWGRGEGAPKPYAAGTWGPASASALLAQHGTCWLEEEN